MLHRENLIELNIEVSSDDESILLLDDYDAEELEDVIASDVSILSHDVNNEISHLVNNSEATMNAVVSNSVGMVIVKLRESYHITEENLSHLFQQCCQEMQDQKVEDEIASAIQYIIQKGNEPLDELDRVTLYVSEEQSEQKIFELREVITLVWIALKDHKRYLHHYHGSEKDRLALATADLPNRLQSFYNCLLDLQRNPLCHQGIRHELIFRLNKTYEEVNIIEDDRSTVYMFLRENIFKLFLEVYAKEQYGEKKRELTALLCDWCMSNNASSVAKAIDPENTIIIRLKQLFLQHGTDSKVISLDRLVNEALCHLPFTADPKQYPELHLLGKIFELSPEISVVVKPVHQWIRNHYILGNTQQFDLLKNFLTMFHFSIELLHFNIYYIRNEAIKAEITRLLDFHQEYIASIIQHQKFLEIPKEIEESLFRFPAWINRHEKCPHALDIAQFFGMWFYAKASNNKNMASMLYEKLLDPRFQSTVILNDDALHNMDFLDFPIHKKMREVVVYFCSRLLLHAVIKAPAEWTPLFSETLQKALPLLENIFHPDYAQGGDEKMSVLYVDQLRQQMRFLLDKNSNTPRPKMMLLLPSHIILDSEWIDLSELLEKKLLLQVYQSAKSHLDFILRLCVTDKNIFFILPSIPAEGRLEFLLQLEDQKIQSLFFDPCEIISTMAFIPYECRVIFLERLHLAGLIVEKLSTNFLAKILVYIPEASWGYLFEVLGADKINSMLNEADKLGSFLSEIQDSQWKTFLGMYGEQRLRSCIRTGDELGRFLKHLTDKTQLQCIDFIGCRLIKDILHNGKELRDMLIHLGRETGGCIADIFFRSEISLEHMQRKRKTMNVLFSRMSLFAPKMMDDSKTDQDMPLSPAKMLKLQ